MDNDDLKYKVTRFARDKNAYTSYAARFHFFVIKSVLSICLMLLTPLLNYISIILVKYHIFLHDFFALAEMYLTRANSRWRRLNSETEFQIRIFCE